MHIVVAINCLFIYSLCCYFLESEEITENLVFVQESLKQPNTQKENPVFAVMC